MNLAPAGSGTRTLFHALLPHSTLAHHNHLRTIDTERNVSSERTDGEQTQCKRAVAHDATFDCALFAGTSDGGGAVSGEDAARLAAIPADIRLAWGEIKASETKKPRPRAEPACFIITLREPVERLEAGFHDTHGGKRVVWDADEQQWVPDIVQIDAVVTNWTIKARTKKCHQREDFLGRTRRESGSTMVFSTPTLYYLLGSEGRHEIHLLCTRTLTDDLNELFSQFGVPNTTVESFGIARTAPNKTRAQMAVLNRTTVHEQALRDWINLVMFPADTVLYRVFCTGSRDGQDAKRVRMITDTVSRQGAQLLARNNARGGAY